MSATATLIVELLTEELPPKALKRLGEAFAEGIVSRPERPRLPDAGERHRRLTRRRGGSR